jgi:hypothetical protein
MKTLPWAKFTMPSMPKAMLRSCDELGHRA